MKKPQIAMLALLVVCATTLATNASAAPASSGLRTAAADRAVIKISDNCETDEEGITHCYDPPPQYEPKKPSKTQQFLEALQRAAEQAAAEKRERDRQRAIQAEERRREKAAEKERRRREAKAEKERRRKEAAAEKKRKQKQAEKAERDRKRRQADADKKAEEKAKDAADAANDEGTGDKVTAAGPPPTCEGDACKGGKVETTTLDGNPVTVVVGPTDEFPPPSTIPDSICELKIGNTTIYCDGYLPGLPPTRTQCRGRTENGCYLRPVTVERLDGESGEACMQFCINKRPPPRDVTDVKPPKQPKKPATVVVNDPGKPAVPTGTATVYREPKRPQTPAVKTGTATLYVWPKPRATPAVKTATAATRVWPKLPATPAVKTAIAARYVEPKVAQ